jgi:hypothetical protein
MTIGDFIAEIRTLAAAEGAWIDQHFWSADAWRDRFANGLTPLDAWDMERCPGLRAL